VQELMAASDIVINERVEIEVRTEGVVDLVVQRSGDLADEPEAVAAGPVVTLGPVENDTITDRTADDSSVDADSIEDEEDEDDDLGDLDVSVVGPAPVDLVLIESDDLPPELAWQERALCAQTDPEAFFPEKGGSTREAKRVCMSCEVRAECLDYALAKDERFGIWGGLSERERRRVKKQAV